MFYISLQQTSTTFFFPRNLAETIQNHINTIILLDSKFDPTKRTAKACSKGQQTYFALKISALLNSATLSKFYKRIILPSVVYGSELWGDLKRMATAPFTYLSTLYVSTPSET